MVSDTILMVGMFAAAIMVEAGMIHDGCVKNNGALPSDDGSSCVSDRLSIS